MAGRARPTRHLRCEKRAGWGDQCNSYAAAQVYFLTFMCFYDCMQEAADAHSKRWCVASGSAATARNAEPVLKYPEPTLILHAHTTHHEMMLKFAVTCRHTTESNSTVMQQQQPACPHTPQCSAAAPCRIQLVSWKPRAFIYHNFLSDAEAEHMKRLAAATVSSSAGDNAEVYAQCHFRGQQVNSACLKALQT